MTRLAIILLSALAAWFVAAITLGLLLILAQAETPQDVVSLWACVAALGFTVGVIQLLRERG